MGLAEEMLKRCDALSLELAQKDKDLDWQTERVREMVGLLRHIDKEIYTLMPLINELIENHDVKEFLEQVLEEV